MVRLLTPQLPTVTARQRGARPWARARRLIAVVMAAAVLGSMALPAASSFAADQPGAIAPLLGPLDGVGDSPLVP